MLTKEDIKKLVAVFATKAELKQEIAKIREQMATKFHFNKVMNMLDKVMGELKDIRQEQKAHYAQHDRINERLEKLESSRNLN